MSVLETFYILFKSDADKAADSMERVEDAADKVEDSLNRADKSLHTAATGTAAAAASSKGLGVGMAGAAVGANATATATAKVAAATAVADANATRLSASFLAMARAAAAPVLAFASLTGLAGVATGRAAEIRELDQFSAKLNSTIGDVDAFQRSIQGMGGESAKALDSLVKIGEKVNEAFSDKESGARKDFTAWGLAFKDAEGNALGATDAMLALAGSLETVSQAEGLARIKKLGIEDAATIELLLKGRAAVQGYMDDQKALGVITEEQAETTRKYYAAMGQLSNQFISAGNSIAGALLPGITEGLRLLSRLADWASDNRKLVEGFFIGVAGAVTTYFLPALGRAAIAVIAATWPFLLMAAAATAIGAAFALAYEDVSAFLNGDPSLIGQLVKDYEWFAEVVRAIGDAFNWLASEWGVFLQQSQDLISFLIDEWGVFLSQTEDAGAAVKALWDLISGGVSAAISGIASLSSTVVDVAWAFTDILGGAVQGVIDLVGVLISKIQGIAGAIQGAANAAAGGGVVMPTVPQGTDLSNPAAAADFLNNGGWAAPAGLTEGQGALSGAGGAPQGLAVPASVNQTSTVNIGDVTVNTQATDAAGVARAVKGALSNELRGTAAAFDDGVDR